MSAADAAAVNLKSIKMFLANGLSTFFINGNPIFMNGPRSLLRNPCDCAIVDGWVFDNFVLVDEPFLKALLSSKAFYQLIIASLIIKSPIIFNKSFRVTSVLFFITYFNLLSWELDKFTLTVLYWVIF